MTSFAFPSRRDLSVDRRPRVYLPLFITRASLVLMLSMAFFCKKVGGVGHGNYENILAISLDEYSSIEYLLILM